MHYPPPGVVLIITLLMTIAVANVDGDGRPDLLFGKSGHINQILLNRGGDGTFSDAVDRIPFEEFDTNSIAFADFYGILDMTIGTIGLQN